MDIIIWEAGSKKQHEKKENNCSKLIKIARRWVMKEIFEQGEFSEYRINNLQKSRGVINESFAFFEEKVPVFISHKHDDLEDLKGIIGFLEKNFNTP